MNSGGKIRHIRERGFTIIELLIVVAVVAILAAVVVVSYGSWRTTVNINAVKSDLRAVAGTMEDARNAENGYPSSIPSSFRGSDNVTLTLIESSSGSFCINGVYASSAATRHYVDQKSGTDGPKSGTCAGGLTPNTPNPVTDVTFAPISSTQIRVQWVLASPNYATRYEAECAQDAAFIVGRLVVKVSGATATTGVVTGVQPSTLYYCRVKAFNTASQSDWVTAPTV